MQPTTAKKKKTGRPKKAVKKEIRACVRLTRAEYFIIKGKAAKAGTKAAAFLRLAAIQSPLRTRLTEEQMQMVRQLVGMANNINQFLKICHKEGILAGLAYFEEFRKLLDEILELFKS